MNRRNLSILAIGAVLLLVAVVVDLLVQRTVGQQAAAPSPVATATATGTPTPAATATTTPTATASPAATGTPTAAATPTITSTPTTVPTPGPTPPPTATAIPVPPTPLPGPIVTNDKLGFGVYNSNISISMMRDFRPALILVQDPEQATAPELRKNFPRALIIGRKFVKDGDARLPSCTNPNEKPFEKGVAFADFVAQTAVPLKGTIDAWVSDNEQATSGAQKELACHASFQQGFVETLQGKYGIDAVAGNDGPGALEPDDYPKFFAKPISEAAYFGIHAYGKPGAKTLQTPDAQWYALRYRMIKQSLDKAGVPLSKKGILLTETGLYDGWRGKVGDAEMAQDFAWLERETQKDTYVRGQMVFALGPNGDQFKSFEIAGTTLLEQLGAYNAQFAGKP